MTCPLTYQTSYCRKILPILLEQTPIPQSELAPLWLETARHWTSKRSHLDVDPALSLLGPFGNPRRSKSGENLLNILREHQLRAATTFFDNNNKYNTWLAPPHPTTGKRQAYQLDHIFIPKYQLAHTSNVKRRFNGTTSNHAALFIKFQLSSMPLLKKKLKKEKIPSRRSKKLTTKSYVEKNCHHSKRKLKNTLPIACPKTLPYYHLQNY